MTNFSVTKNPAPKTEQQRNEILENPGFGKFFTDHMVLIDWEKDNWNCQLFVAQCSLAIQVKANVLNSKERKSPLINWMW